MQLSQSVLAQLKDRDLSTVIYLVVHHTADDNQVEDIADIAAEEEASQDFVTCGYHAVIWKTGEVQYCRPIGKWPAANHGLNPPSYAVSLEGNFQPDDAGYEGEKPSAAAISALTALVLNVKAKLPNLKFLIGHRDVAPIRVKQENVSQAQAAADYGTACPGTLLYNMLHGLRVATGLATPPELL